MAAPVYIHTYIHGNTSEHTDTHVSSGMPQRVSVFILDQGGAAKGPLPLSPCAFAMRKREALRDSDFSEDLLRPSIVP